MAKCCDYHSGILKEPVEFQRLTRISDGAGGFNEQWVAISGAPSRAMVKPKSGSERWASERVEARANYRVVTRYFSDLDETDRVVIRGRPCQIRFIGNVEMADKWLEIDIEMGAAT